MQFTEERLIVRALMDYMKKNNISNSNKEKIYNMVIDLENKTELQKERFIRYYGLKPKDFIRENMCVIAKKENVKPRAVRSSIFAIRHALAHTSDDNFLILKNIYLKEVKK